jgi:DNA repair protein RadC
MDKIYNFKVATPHGPVNYQVQAFDADEAYERCIEYHAQDWKVSKFDVDVLERPAVISRFVEDSIDTMTAEISIVFKNKIKLEDRVYTKSSKDCEKIFSAIPEMIEKREHKELFYVLFLNRSNAVLSWMKVSEGGITATVVDQKIILQAAILQGASGIILCHNHPSGILDPSVNDDKMTKNLKESRNLMGFSLLDHIILGETGKYYSYADNGSIL